MNEPKHLMQLKETETGKVTYKETEGGVWGERKRERETEKEREKERKRKKIEREKNRLRADRSDSYDVCMSVDEPVVGPALWPPARERARAHVAL